MTKDQFDLAVFACLIILGIGSLLLALRTIHRLESQGKINELRTYRFFLFIIPFGLIYLIFVFLKERF